MANSTKIKLSNYAILEYFYSSENQLISAHNFSKVSNIEKKIDVYHNRDTSASYTKNVLDYTFIEIENDRIGHCDIDRPFSLSELDDNINLTPDLSIPTSLNVRYDKVRLHLLSGYQLTGLDGIGLRIRGEENEQNNISYLLSHIYLPGEGTTKINPDPFSLGNQIYDRYIEILIPSISYLNEQYYNNFAYGSPQVAEFLTSSGKAWKAESLIYIDFYEFYEFEEINDRATYRSRKVLSTSIPQVDQNSLITAQITESSSGDYFEFFAKYDGNFIADYIAELNSRGDIYIIINEIKVYENYADLTRVKVSEFPFVQNKDFDKANKFRPIISPNAYSFIIEYNMRLINQIENTQIIRTATLTCGNNLAKKYGPKLGQISVQESSAPINIINRVNSSVYDLSINEVVPQVTNVISEVVRYYEKYKFSINIENVIQDINKTMLSKQLEDDNFIYGNGNGILYINSFDNNIKIQIYNSSNVGSIQPLNISSLVKIDSSNQENIALVFFGPSNTKKYIYGDPSTIKENEVIFKISSKDSSKIVDYVNNKFSIIYQNSAGEEISIYEGKFTSSIDEYNSLRTSEKESSLSKAIDQVSKIMASTQSKLDSLLNEVRKPIQNITNVTNVQNVTNVSQIKTQATGEIEVKKIEKEVESKNFEKSKELENNKNEKNKKLIDDILNGDKVEFKLESDIAIKDARELLENVGNPSNSTVSSGETINKPAGQLNLKELIGTDSNLGLDSNINTITPNFLKNNLL